MVNNQLVQTAADVFKSEYSIQNAGKKVKSTKSKKTGTVKGGALMDNVKNLAVPFAILLAKKGLETMYSNKSSNKDDSEISVTKLNRKRTVAGGKVLDKQMQGGCGSDCDTSIQSGGIGTKTKTKSTKTVKCEGGNNARGNNAMLVKNRFAKLSKEIDNFLEKHNLEGKHDGGKKKTIK